MKHFLNKPHVPHDSHWIWQHVKVTIFTMQTSWRVFVTLLAQWLPSGCSSAKDAHFIQEVLYEYELYQCSIWDFLGVSKIIYLLSMRHKKENVKGTSVLDLLGRLSFSSFLFILLTMQFHIYIYYQIEILTFSLLTVVVRNAVSWFPTKTHNVRNLILMPLKFGHHWVRKSLFAARRQALLQKAFCCWVHAVAHSGLLIQHCAWLVTNIALDVSKFRIFQ